MFNDRDLWVLGAGALLAVLCLLLPLPFAGKAAVGFLALVSFMVLALLRLGPDRVTVETWLARRLRFARRARRFTYQQPGWRLPEIQQPARIQQVAARLRSIVRRLIPIHQRSAGEPAARLALDRVVPDQVHLSGVVDRRRLPVELALPQSGLFPLVTVWLAVVGAYFVAWLAQGGAQELARLWR